MFVIGAKNLMVALEALQRLAIKYGLKVNYEKSGILIINSSKKRRDFILKINKTECPVVDSYQYLGISFNGRGIISTQLAKIKKRDAYL